MTEEEAYYEEQERSTYQEELDRHNRLCKRAQEMGITVDTGELKPPKLNEDGSDPEPTRNSNPEGCNQHTGSGCGTLSPVEKLPKAKHFTEMNSKEARERLSTVLQAISHRETEDAVREPQGGYDPELRSHAPPSEPRREAWERAVAAKKAAIQEAEDLRMRIKFLERQAKKR